MSRHIHIPGSHTQDTTGGEDQAHTSGWKAWQDPGRRRGFWERILSHLTEALCAELTVKVTTLRSSGDPGGQDLGGQWPCKQVQDGEHLPGAEGWPISHPIRKGMGVQAGLLTPNLSFAILSHPLPLGGREGYI